MPKKSELMNEANWEKIVLNLALIFCCRDCSQGRIGQKDF